MPGIGAAQSGIHVLLVPSWYPSPEAPYNGTFFREQAEMLHRAGFQVSVLAVSVAGTGRNPRRRPAVSVENGIRVVRVRTRLLPRGIRVLEDFLLNRVVEEAYSRLCTDRPHVIHAHSALPGVLAARRLAQRLDLPFVFTEHRPSSIAPPKKGIRARRLHRAVRDAEARVAVSEPFAEELGRFYGTEKFDVSQLPVSNEFFEAEIPERADEPCTFLHVSHLAPGKQVPFLVETFAEFAAGRDARLTIAGGNDTSVDELRRHAELLNVGDKVKLLGAVERNDLPELMAGADCFVLVSEKEAGGTVLSEARAAGLPIIVTDTWAGRHHGRHTNTGAVRVIPVGSKEALLGALVRAYENPVEMKERLVVRSEALDLVSEAAFVADQRHIYEGAISRHNQPFPERERDFRDGLRDSNGDPNA